MSVDIIPLEAVDAPTKTRSVDPKQLALRLNGVRVGVCCNDVGATAFLHRDVTDEELALIRHAIADQLSHLKIASVKTLPPKPTFERATAADF